jgi:hypothetical protein
MLNSVKTETSYEWRTLIEDEDAFLAYLEADIPPYAGVVITAISFM